MTDGSLKPRGRWARLWKPLAGLAALVVAVAWSTGAFHPKVQPGTLDAPAGFAVPTGAETVTAEIRPIPPRIDVVGTVRSERLVHVSARLGAAIKEVFVSAGSVVKEGQPLVTLDDRDLQEQRAAAEAQLKQAQSEYQRNRQLFDQKAATEQALVATEAAANAAKAQVERINVLLTYTRIVAPFDGSVTERRVEAGDLAGLGQVLLSVYDPSRFRLECPVPVRLVTQLGLGQEVQTELNYPARAYTGRVSEIVGEIDPASRTQLVKVQLGGDMRGVLPGTFGRLWLHDTPCPTLLVPATAIYRVGQLEMVQVVREGRAYRRLVKTGVTSDGRVEVLSGLRSGEAVLVNPVDTEK